MVMVQDCASLVRLWHVKYDAMMLHRSDVCKGYRDMYRQRQHST